MRARTLSHGLFAAALVAGALLVACGPSSFDPADLIESVRILASRSDQPYAKPGATVHSEVLAVDGRPDASTNEPMRVFWLPFVCVNPPNDAFYACFSALESSATHIAQVGIAPDGGGGAKISGHISRWDGGVEAGVGAGGLGSLRDAGSLSAIPTGVDVSPLLVQGSRAVFALPSDIVSSHPPKKGVTPYGLAVVFNIACAGHVEIVPLDPNNPDPEQIPFGCFDAQHQRLTPNDYVIGYTEVFAYCQTPDGGAPGTCGPRTLTNHNPVVSSFTFAGHPVSSDPALDGGAEASASFAHCTASDTNKCPNEYAVTSVTDASWEPDPQDPGPDGGSLGEQIWVDYYTTIGSLSSSAILIDDPSRGRVTVPKPENLTVTSAEKGTLWAVVHDNRGGATWVTVGLHAE